MSSVGFLAKLKFSSEFCGKWGIRVKCTVPNMNKMKTFNLVYKIKNAETEKKLCGGSSLNGIYLNKKSLYNLFIAANM